MIHVNASNSTTWCTCGLLTPVCMRPQLKYMYLIVKCLFSLHPKTSAVQVSPSEVLVECHSTGLVHTVKTDIHINGVFVTKVCAACTNTAIRATMYMYICTKDVCKDCHLRMLCRDISTALHLFFAQRTCKFLYCAKKSWSVEPGNKVSFFFQEYVAVWSGRKLAVYAIAVSQDKSLVRVAGTQYVQKFISLLLLQ